MANKQKVLLIILDGWGIKHDYEGNAITRAKTPFYDSLWNNYSHLEIPASGEAVGLPEGQMGTSEVNHMTIGGGRILFQDLVKINSAVKNEEFLNNETFKKVFNHVIVHNSTLHIKGLISDGGVHSHMDHVIEIVRAAKKAGVTKIYLHVFTDGRDTLPKSAIKFVTKLEDELKKIGAGKIATISGRYYAMDRDHNWDRTDKAFEVIVGKKEEGKGITAKSAVEAIEKSYEAGITDEYIEPVQIELEPGENGCVTSDDAVIFANFRNDRPRQLTERMLSRGPKGIMMATMTQYDPKYNVQVAFPLESTKNCLGEILAENKIKQLRITETEKFAHVTFFFNCKHEEAYEGEDRIMLDSYSDIKTHDERPEMRAMDIANMIAGDIAGDMHQVIVTNLCNADMVGHTSNIKAAMTGIETVDKALDKIVTLALDKNYLVMLTADHGNADEMIDEQTQEKLTQHSLSPVPFILISKEKTEIKKTHGSLSDIAPTILKALNISKPIEMTGESLI